MADPYAEPGVDLRESEKDAVYPDTGNDDFAKFTFNHRLPDGSIVEIDPLADTVRYK